VQEGASLTPLWQVAADATFEVATAALSSSDASAAKVLAASLRALGRLVPVLKSEALASASAELACKIVSAAGATRPVEACRVQALQVLRTIARRSPEILTEQGMAAAVRAVCAAAKDSTPSVDDLDEVSASALAARDCVRSLARAAPKITIPLVYDTAGAASQSRDAMDRAAAMHVVVFALCGAREAPPAWAVPLGRALADPAIWVRQAACEGASLLADALQQSPATTEGFLVLLAALAERLPAEAEPELVQKLAQAAAALFRELSTDEAASVLASTVPLLLQALPKSTEAAQGAARGSDAAEATTTSSAVAALAVALGAAASSAADTFIAYAVPSAAVLLPLLRAMLDGSGADVGLSPAVFAACLDAAGSVVGSAWGQAEFQPAREELAMIAHRVLTDGRMPSEVRASAHGFFGDVALACFEGFAPHLQQVVPPAVAAMTAEDGSEVKTATRRRAVRTDQHEERVAAIEALGAYASAVGAPFAAHCPSVLPPLCAQAQNPSAEVRVAVANTIGRVGRMLGDLAGALPEGPDRQQASLMAQGLASALRGSLDARDLDGAAALRSGLMAKEDLADCSGFVALAGCEMAALATAGRGQRAEDVESSEGEDEELDADDDS